MVYEQAELQGRGQKRLGAFDVVGFHEMRQTKMGKYYLFVSQEKDGREKDGTESE